MLKISASVVREKPDLVNNRAAPPRMRVGSVGPPLLAAVGPLQFEVVQYRLQAEYQAESHLESSRWTLIRWWRKEGLDMSGADAEWLPETVMDSTFGVDRDERPVVLFADEWALRNFGQRNPGVELGVVPFGGEKK